MDYDNDDNLPAMMGNNTSLAVQLAQAELNQSVVTARSFPRSLTRAKSSIMSLVLLDEETAAECIYVLPRAGKPIKGPSIRFAEIVAAMYGNCHVGARIVAVDKFDKIVIAEGIFHDLETGMKQTSQIQRRISDKNGKIYNDDMVAMTGNAAMAIARRNAILTSVPKAVWRAAFEAVDGVVIGKNGGLLSERREKAISAFAQFGISGQQIFDLLEVEGLDDVQLDDIVTLTAIFRTVKSGESNIETYFPKKVDDKARANGVAAKMAELADKTRAAAAEKKALADKGAEDRAAEKEAAAAAKEAEKAAAAAEKAAAKEAAAAEKEAAKAAKEAAKAEKTAEKEPEPDPKEELEPETEDEPEIEDAEIADPESDGDQDDDETQQFGDASDHMQALFGMVIRELESGATMAEIEDVYGKPLDDMGKKHPEMRTAINAKAEEMGNG